MSEDEGGSITSAEEVFVRRFDEVGNVVSKRKMTQTEVNQMDTEIEKTIADSMSGRPEVGAAAPVDEYSLAQMRADVLKGRDKDPSGHWRQVMEYWGFNWLEPHQLNEVVGPMKVIPPSIKGLAGEIIHDHLGRDVANTNLYWTRPHAEGQWRSDFGNRRPPREFLRDRRAMAFTMADLIDMFESPQAFDEWARGRVKQTRRVMAAIRKRRR